MSNNNFPSYNTSNFSNPGKPVFNQPLQMMPGFPGQVLSSGANGRDILIPSDVVGAIIGKNGETIKQLQEKSGCRMQIVQDGVYAGSVKLMRLFGEREAINDAHRYAHEIMVSKNASINGAIDVQTAIDKVTKMIVSRRSDVIEDNTLELPVPREVVGFVIGKHGETIKKISNDSGCQVQFSLNSNEDLFDKVCVINGKPEQIKIARSMVIDIIEKKSGYVNMMPSIGSQNVVSVDYGVPVDKAGLIIGKSGETIRQICAASGCYIELNNNSSLTNGLKYFTIRGSSEQIIYAKQIINDKINSSINLINSGNTSVSSTFPSPANSSNCVPLTSNNKQCAHSSVLSQSNINQSYQSQYSQNSNQINTINPGVIPCSPINWQQMNSQNNNNQQQGPAQYSGQCLTFTSPTVTPQVIGSSGHISYAMPQFGYSINSSVSQPASSVNKQQACEQSSTNAVIDYKGMQPYAAWASYYNMQKFQSNNMY